MWQRTQQIQKALYLPVHTALVLWLAQPVVPTVNLWSSLLVLHSGFWEMPDVTTYYYHSVSQCVCVMSAHVWQTESSWSWIVEKVQCSLHVWIYDVLISEGKSGNGKGSFLVPPASVCTINSVKGIFFLKESSFSRLFHWWFLVILIVILVILIDVFLK